MTSTLPRIFSALLEKHKDSSDVKATPKRTKSSKKTPIEPTIAAKTEAKAPVEAPNHIPINEIPTYTPRKTRVVCVGAGFSGLMLAYLIQKEKKMDEYVDLTIYEKNNDVGGTWLENRYPGVACDVPAPIYTFSWAPNPDWSEFYAKGPEIWQYVKNTADKHGLEKNIKFQSKVIESIWSEADGKWKLVIERDGTRFNDECDIFINAAGILNHWKWPEITGLHDFKGKLMHSAVWDQDYDYKGKRVALIGNGSTALQILPAIRESCAHVVNYIRRPTWISANYAAHHTRDGSNFKYTEEEKEAMRNDPAKLLAYRKSIEHDMNKFIVTLIKDTPEQKGAVAAFTQIMRERLQHDEQLCEILIPKWDVGCRRLSPGDGYLESLMSSNVTPEFRGIDQVTSKGIKTVDGSEEEFDLIICATGFDVSFRPTWKMIGRNGADLSKVWEKDPKAYMSIMAPSFPNYMIFNGPNCAVGHGSLLAVMEATAGYIVKWIKKYATEDIKSFEPTPAALSDLEEYTQEFLKRTVWTSGCKSWYKNADGKLTALWGGSAVQYREVLEVIRGEDFSIGWNSANRFRFFGNGFTVRETEGQDLSWYLMQ
ncbi:Similar to Putative sterigmatocystin biosynthesis monooxygenase stcW; acc. no. Q00730 [Pyronema omphalodes CBS 100304]|uniref:Similar to Putative sterigmatocystin biosynthesis monooxygenase stcW acc. no. Q00730 n=1 Tax=Pyronema omphalodes (strain CBS 100304) TaxID=1076935 RepID=U4LIK3_PYROM|nr:Similar to Putative sterigmatocystin biosynthesis monooxygenase stcW; acc. no. Q00730 [Pyronema omphalodes CBS 100304]